MSTRISLPPGQREIEDFPRFGLPKYARRFRAEFDPLQLRVAGEVRMAITLNSGDLDSLPRVRQESDFHCVTTWTKRGLRWSGFRFIDFFEMIVKPEAQPSEDAGLVIFRSRDGFRAILPLEDLRSSDVLLADSLEGEPLSAKHGAPLRLVAPAHYGYKHVKHLKVIEFRRDASEFHPPAFRFMDHPRARVAFEERGRGLPAWLLRTLYRPLIKPLIRQFERYMR